ncbi:MAG TPA: glycosyltransferase family 2 protein [Gemmatimonadales bacterium]|jgi:cellulose synthase (UDP-forming)|nr:glycosyltransferase family 2 protein [Gemmatimonadales bacterium]
MPNEHGLWRHRQAREVRLRDRFVLSALGGLGAVSLIRLADWWFRPEHIGQPALFVALSLAFWYGMSRIVLGWINYAAISRPIHRDAPSGLSVAIFTTSSPGEPLAMFEKTLAACARISYPHRTYLLDDTGDPRFRDVAQRHGATWLELVGIPGAKAGKINRALERTTEEYILVLDPDHLPFPEMLDRVLGHFSDSTVGFVQVAQAYYNQDRSFTARGAAEQTYAFYGPGQMGLHGHGAAVAIGANCTFRRSALMGIGGHGIGLAEDLVTAIRLHAAGWRSVYVPEVVSRGLVPEELGSFYKQQLKWSRGVYEVVFAELPRLIGTLRWRQRLSYLTIGTYYGFGVTMPIFLLFPYLFLWAGVQPAAMRFGEFVTYAAPVGIIGSVIYIYVQRWLADPSTERGTHWRGLMLKLACWPVYLAGTLLAIVRAEIPYIPTAKEAVRGRFFRLGWPQLTQFGVFATTLVWIIYRRIWRTAEGALALSSEAVWGMVFFATLPVLFSCGAIYAAWQARSPAAGAPWDAVDPNTLGGPVS